eukprot:3662032-Rhodomonas_salina.1
MTQINPRTQRSRQLQRNAVTSATVGSASTAGGEMAAASRWHVVQGVQAAWVRGVDELADVPSSSVTELL